MSVEEMLVALTECVGPDGTRLMPEIHPDVAMQIRAALRAWQAMMALPKCDLKSTSHYFKETT